MAGPEVLADIDAGLISEKAAVGFEPSELLGAEIAEPAGFEIDDGPLLNGGGKFAREVRRDPHLRRDVPMICRRIINGLTTIGSASTTSRESEARTMLFAFSFLIIITSMIKLSLQPLRALR
jgi:hypothetical protein